MLRRWYGGKSVRVFSSSVDPLSRHGRAGPAHARFSCGGTGKTWMAGTRPGMTNSPHRANLPDLELAVRFACADDDMLRASIAAMRIAPILVIGRCHHIDERPDRRIIHQRQIVPLVAGLRAERDRLRIASPPQRAAARLDHRHGKRAVAQIGVPAAAVAVERAIAE